MAGRGVVYMVWGDIDEAILDRTRASIAEHHPELPVHVQRSASGSLLDNAKVYGVSPFAEALYLVMDTVVLGALDFGFESARRTGLALSICECPWVRRYGGLTGDLVEYNTGVMFFTRQARAVFEAWAGCAAEIDSSIVFVHEGQTMRMSLNDQAGFAKAVDETGFAPFVVRADQDMARLRSRARTDPRQQLRPGRRGRGDRVLGSARGRLVPGKLKSHPLPGPPPPPRRGRDGVGVILKLPTLGTRRE